MSVAVKFHAKGLVSDNTPEEVRDFQEVKETKNSHFLECQARNHRHCFSYKDLRTSLAFWGYSIFFAQYVVKVAMQLVLFCSW